MKKITKDCVFAAHQLKPRRKCFADYSGIRENENSSLKYFSVSFSETIQKIFEKDTGFDLFYNDQFENFYRMIKNDNEFNIIKEWERKQGRLIYLRDCLSLSLAIDRNLIDSTSAEYTQIGKLEHTGKNNRDQTSINQLADTVSQVIQNLPYYKNADVICSVPPGQDKDFDLPSIVTSNVSTRISKQNVTAGFDLKRKKSSVKTATLDEKWGIWENAQVSFENKPQCSVNGKTVILIDDKYQSGITIQYIAMKLQQAGAREVYGLSFVKTLRDTDNV